MRARWRLCVCRAFPHIYCRPSAPAREPLRRKCRFFHTAQKRRIRLSSLPALPPERTAGALRVGCQGGRGIGEFGRGKRCGSMRWRLRSRYSRKIAPGVSPHDRADAESFRRSVADGAISRSCCGKAARSRTRCMPAVRLTEPVYEKTNTHLGMTPGAYRKGAPGMQIGYTVANSSIGKVLVAATPRACLPCTWGKIRTRLVDALHKEYPRAEIRRTHETKRAMAAGNPASHRRGCAERGFAAGRASNRISAPRVAGIAEDSARHDATYTRCARLGQPRSVRAVARACATNPVSIVAVPPRDPHGWYAGGIPLGLQRKEKPWNGRRRRLQRKGCVRQASAGLFDLVPLGQSGLNLLSPIFRFFQHVLVVGHEIIAAARSKEFLCIGSQEASSPHFKSCDLPCASPRSPAPDRSRQSYGRRDLLRPLS